MSRFLFDTYKQHHEDGIAAHRAGDYPRARMHYLLASKYLLAMAKQAEGADFRNQRIKKAERLMEIAGELQGRDKIAGPSTPDDNADKKAGPIAEKDAKDKADKWVVTDVIKTGFDDVAGLEDVKEIIRLRVIYPLENPELTERFGKKAGGGVLLYGPPGTGKTMIARAIASELDAAFMDVRCSDIMSKWVGDAEKNIRELFDAARSYPRCVIFMDETEAIVSKRGSDSTVMNRVIPEFLAQIDGLKTNENMLLLLGATNRPWDMDEAALRTGRFGELIYVPLPDEQARLRILEMNMAKIPLAEDVTLAELAQKLQGYSGADIKGFIEAVTDYPYQRQIQTGQEQFVKNEDVEKAMLRISPSVDSRMLAKYEKYHTIRQGR